MNGVNCATSISETYKPSEGKPWNKRRAVHLFRRISTGAKIDTILSALSKEPSILVDELVDIARNMPLTPAPPWANWTVAQYNADPDKRNEQVASQFLMWSLQWVKDIKTNGLRDKMSWFWSNHFVTKFDTYLCPSWMYRYHQLLQKHALGNFKTFVLEMGITPAMLVFLNNVQNTRFQPNENYARELLELFTLGVDNGYTQQDIVNVARAITGWNGINPTNLCGDIVFISALWDPGTKTIFGKTGNFGYNDVINLLFTERPVQISEFICKKLYAYFVNPDINIEVVQYLAKIFRDENFEIAPVMKAMFKSEHFFDDATVGTIIPGHLEYFLTFMNEMNINADDELILATGIGIGEFNQQIFNPTDVAGWPGNRAWINTASLPFRSDSILNIIGYYYLKNLNKLEELRILAKKLTSEDEDNPEQVTNSLVDYFLPNGLQKSIDYKDALAAFKGEVPENYFETKLWNLNWEYVPLQVLYLIIHLSNLPEFQLK